MFLDVPLMLSFGSAPATKNCKAISVSIAVAERPICAPKRSGLIQKTAKDMVTISTMGKIRRQM